MEEEIKIIKASKIMSDDIPHSEHSKRLRKALENLIKGYRELEEELKREKIWRIRLEKENEDTCNEVNNNYIRKSLVIPKSKTAEKIEELDNMIKEINKRKTSKVHSRRDYSF